MKSFILSMFQDDTGATSSMRVGFLLVVAYITIPKAIVFVKTGVIQPFTPDDWKVLGIATGGKLYQNGQENAAPPAPKA